MKNKNLNTLIKISLLSAIAFLFMYFEMSLPIFPDFLKLDISDFPALVGAFALGPVSGIVIELLKNILHIVLKGTQTALIGEAANFLVGSVFVYTAGMIYKRKKTRGNAVISMVAGTIIMSVFAGLLNAAALLPLYEKVLHFPIAAVVGAASKINHSITNLNSLILLCIIPFNLLKGVIVSLISFAVYKGISPILHKDNAYDTQGQTNP